MNVKETESEFLYFTEVNPGLRIDKYLSEQMTSYSRSHIQKLLKDQCVQVNNLPVKVNYKLRTGDQIKVCLPEPETLNVEPENIPLDILYEDQDLLVVNKPKGMVVHPAAGHYSGTLVNALMYHCKDQLSGINGILRPGIVHRIDMDTTGTLVVCKNDISHQSLGGAVKRTFHYKTLSCNPFMED